MAEQSRAWRQELVNVDGTDLSVVKGDSGRPLLILHEELGHPGWLKWHTALARDHTLIIPLHPGFGVTSRRPDHQHAGTGGLLFTLCARPKAGARGRGRIFAGRLDRGRDGGL
jgi:hypothetical protein